MPNRSISDIPSFFDPSRACTMEDALKPYRLGIYDIKFLHFHPFLELGVCVSGKGYCIVEGVEYAFSEGDVQVIFPYQKHLSRSEGRQNSTWLWFTIDPLNLLGAWGAPDLSRMERLLNTCMGICGIIPGERYPLLNGLVKRVVLPGEKERRLSCLHTLVEELAQESQGMEPLTLRPNRLFLQLEPALRQVQQRLARGEAPLARKMAQACRMSDASFRRAFHLMLGQSPKEYIEACRMRKAQRMLLLTREPVTQIAFAVGYEDISGFNRRFLRTFGMPPLRYRQCGGLRETDT